MTTLEYPHEMTFKDMRLRRLSPHPRRLAFHWVVDITSKTTFDWEIFEDMGKWLKDNIERSSVVTTLPGSRSIKCVAFDTQTEATMFYLRFIGC